MGTLRAALSPSPDGLITFLMQNNFPALTYSLTIFFGLTPKFPNEVDKISEPSHFSNYVWQESQLYDGLEYFRGWTLLPKTSIFYSKSSN